MKSRKVSARFAYIVCCVLIGVSLLFGACKRTGGGKRYKLAFITNNASDFWTIARKGTEKAAAELPNADIEFRIDSRRTATRPLAIAFATSVPTMWLRAARPARS